MITVGEDDKPRPSQTPTPDEITERRADSAILRRSLTKGQRAAITLEFSEMVEELRREAKERSGTRTDLRPELATGCKSINKALDPGSGVSQGRVKEILAEKAGEYGKLGGRGNKKETLSPDLEEGFNIWTNWSRS